jgi:very-short-patch-repair endonuclease
MNSPSPLAGEGKASRSDARERGKLLRYRAKAMRSAPTEAEHRLWQIVRAHRFSAFKFRRQVPIDHYIVDFLCPARRLIVELDGGQHAESTNDLRRDAYLQSQGFHIIRIWNNELFTNEEGVAAAILNALQAPLPNPSPAEGRGA